MKKLIVCLFVLLIAPAAAIGQDATATLDAAAKVMGTENLTSIQYLGTGSAYNLGQAVDASQPWPRFILRSYLADVNYATPAMRLEVDRTNPDGSAPFGGIKQIQLVSGSDAWNMGANGMPAPAPAAVAERQLNILLTPAGFIRAAKANKATLRAQGAEKLVTFTTPDRRRVQGTLNSQNVLVKTETILDNPVFGDMPVETTYADYSVYAGTMFPGTITQKQGGHPVLELKVTEVRPNGAIAIEAPAAVRGAKVPPVTVTSQKLSDGVWYLTGGSHHSVLVEFRDHLVVIEGPLNEERSTAVIAEVRKLVPAKPIRYVVNSHVHFDHSGGLRTFAAEGAAILTAVQNKAFYDKAYAIPRTLNPDKAAQAKRKPTVEGVNVKRVLSDGTRTLELHIVKQTGHADAMLLAYLPKEKMLVEVDIYTPGPPNAPAPAMPNAAVVELLDHIQRLNLDVAQIAALHGRVATIAEMGTASGK